MAESRKYPRMRVLLDCVVSDLTNLGVRVKIPNTVNLPEDVAITFDGGRTCRPCRVAWRTLSETGLQFTGPTPQSAA